MLIVEDGIAGLGSGVDAVEDLRFLIQVVAVRLEALIPIGEFDDDFDLGIDGLCGADYQTRETSSIVFRRKLVQLSVPLAAISESVLVL